MSENEARSEENARDQLIAEWHIVRCDPEYGGTFADWMWDGAVRWQASRKVEPTVEEWSAEVAAERARHPDKGYTAEHDRKHGLKHLANWAIDYARRGKTVETSSMVLALLDTAESVQVEVTNAMVERGLEISREFPMKRGLDNAYNVMRAALEAAMGGGEQ